MASLTDCLRILLVACLAPQIAAFVVQRGDTHPPRNPISDKEETNNITQLTSPANVSTTTCVLPAGMATRIQSYQPVVDRIIKYVTTGDFKGLVYSSLAEMIDSFGPRMVRRYITLWDVMFIYM